MPRLIVNPGTDAAWEIQLQPGVNTLGRAEDNQFQIADNSISSSHCEVVVNDSGIVIKDLGSTNGTYINGNQVQEAALQHGQRVHLGNVELLVESESAAARAKPRVRLAISKPEAAPVSQPAPAKESPPATIEAEAPPIETVTVTAAYCKSHPKTPAHYVCNKCHKYFCDLCVTTRHAGSKVGKFCRSCGVECAPVQIQRHAGGGERGFFARLPGAWIYPFRGIGSVVLICATLAFSALEFLSGGLLFIFGMIVLYGFLFLFMQNIIHTTAADESEPLGFPDAGGLIGAAFTLGGTIMASYWLFLAVLIARVSGVEVPGGLIIAAFVLGCFYWPMAFLAVAMKDSVMAANPLVVIPAILKCPVEYFVTAILLIGVFAVRRLGGLMSGAAGEVSFTTRDMSVLFTSFAIQAVWAFVSIYLLVVTMRILALLYISKKHKFGWFNY